MNFVHKLFKSFLNLLDLHPFHFTSLYLTHIIQFTPPITPQVISSLRYHQNSYCEDRIKKEQSFLENQIFKNIETFKLLTFSIRCVCVCVWEKGKYDSSCNEFRYNNNYKKRSAPGAQIRDSECIQINIQILVFATRTNPKYNIILYKIK
jgi:hypothetical protein